MGNAETIDNLIIVQGYSERYVHAVRHVLGIEGGYVNDPVDRGGATKFGISLRFLVAAGNIDENADGFKDFDLDMDGDIDGADIRKLTKGDAVFLYHRHFWQELDCESFPAPIGEMLFDQGVNGGLTAARKLLQQALNKIIRDYHTGRPRLVVDGQIGLKTRAALAAIIERHGISAVVAAYRRVAKTRYHEIVRRNPSQVRFLNGWLRRADQLGRYG